MQLTFVALMGCLRFLHKVTAPGPKENKKEKRDGGREGEERTLEGRGEKQRRGDTMIQVSDPQRPEETKLQQGRNHITVGP